MGQRRPVFLRTGLQWAAVVVATVLTVQLGFAPGAVAAALDPAIGDVLAREPQLTPAELGDGVTDGLRYGDPTEGLALVNAPEASSDGGAHLSYPLPVPPGRGLTPELSLDYDSAGGNGWVGNGWDLSPGDISVDTSFGVPRFDRDYESESYLIDGEMLIPNALGSTWEKRLRGDRQDYTRKRETEYAQIIRHEVGTGGPANYYWEVHDKAGNVSWYGGYPDDGGPDGKLVNDTHGDPLTIDRSAIVTDAKGNAVRWLLSAQRDIGVNLMRYHYVTVRYRHASTGWVVDRGCASSDDTLCAAHTYLSRIDYTAGAAKSGHQEDPPYQVHFQRASQLGDDAARPDPVLDASGGYLDLVSDRLARVEVRYGKPNPITDDEGDTTEGPRKYDELAIRYDLHYRTGPYGKSLLSSVDQVGSDTTTKASHTFDYFDDVQDAQGNYQGFDKATTTTWNTHDDLSKRALLTTKQAIGVLGSSETNSAEGHAYLGFNPAIPEKLGSFGGSFQVGGGATESLAEWIDLDGDGLPDKVFRQDNDTDRNGPIYFRLNRSAPGGTTTFGDRQTVVGLKTLSYDDDIDLQGSLEAYPGASIAFGLGGGWARGKSYFSDVNADGLPDYVSDGSVYFNHLQDGIPTFVKGDSGTTSVPIDDGTPARDELPELKDVEDQLRAQSPLVDVVRRWVAPFDGTVSIEAPVTLNPPTGNSIDGVQVAIQRNGRELVDATLTRRDAQAFTSPVTTPVSAGDRLYFRLGSIDDGTADDVGWSPTVRYTALSARDVATVPTDANGLSQLGYAAKDDFTLSGRPGTLLTMPLRGRVRFEGTVAKSKVTSDDLTLVVSHNGTAVPGSADLVLPADFVGTRHVSLDFDVDRPVVPTTKGQRASADTVSALLSVDSPIDLTTIAWTGKPTLTYLSAVDADGQAVPDTDGTSRSFDLVPDVEQYPVRSGGAPVLPWSASTGGRLKLQVTVNRASGFRTGTAVLSVKHRAPGQTGPATLVDQQTLTVPAGLGPVSLPVTLAGSVVKGDDHWFELAVRDAATADKLTSVTIKLDGAGTTVPATLYRTGQQGVFPLAYRGWAVAGYRAEGKRATEPLREGDFTLPEASELPDKISQPKGFDDPNFRPPTPANAYLFMPVDRQTTVPGQAEPVQERAWEGSRPALSAGPERARSSRLATDSVSVAGSAGSGRAVIRQGTTRPNAALTAGLGPLGVSFAVSRTDGLVDYQDLNGDGYPDVIRGGHVQYTTPRGGYVAGSTAVDHLDVTNSDLTLGFAGGLDVGLIDLKSNAKGNTNATQGNGANKGEDPSDSGPGLGLGVGGSLQLSWTSPNASGPKDSPASSNGSTDPLSDYADQFAKTPQSSAGLPIQQSLADVNGDGLPDRVYTTPNGVFARYNLGYSFADAPIKLATGGFEAQESYAGGTSFGFSTPWHDFGGGVALDWNVDMSRYTWRDVNGDGLLDQLHKINNTDPPTVAFGTGSGLLPPVRYGDFFSAELTPQLGSGQQVAFDRSTGVGGGVDFTVPVGPLCLVACYLIINPGASYQNGISSTEVDLTDVDGDGYADTVRSLDDDQLEVRTNRTGRTNLLKAVHNPLGGTTSLDYTRLGNTRQSPESVWAMSSVDVDDGHRGDGVDVARTRISYDGLRYDRLHRESLGFARVVATRVDAAGQALRATRTDYLNDNVFVAGLQQATAVLDGTGRTLQANVSNWALRDIRADGPVTPVGQWTGLGDVASLGRSMAPLLISTQELWYADGTTVGQQTRTEYGYDRFGDVLTERDLGQLEDPADDVLTSYVYSTCSNATTPDDPTTPENEDIGCVPAGPRVSPLWFADLCATWANLPVRITVTNGRTGSDLVRYRERDGRTAVCNNNSVTHLEETIGDGAVAVTDLNYDDWGSYNRIVYPAGGTGRRYAVHYTYDDDRHSDIAAVTEYDLDQAGAEAFIDSGIDETTPLLTGTTTTARFDPLSGRVSRRVDANGNATDYGYDALGRIATTSAPHPVADAAKALLGFDYHLGGDAYALVHHADQQHPGQTIDTAAFVDGTGRVIQTKRDASLFTGAGKAATTGLVVSGGMITDDLGRPVQQFNPRVGKAGLTAVDAEAYTGPTTRTSYNLFDQPTRVDEPAQAGHDGSRVTTTSYGYGSTGAGAPTLFRTTTTPPNGRSSTSYTDIRGQVRAVDDAPAGAPALRTSYGRDGLGQLLQVTDSAGRVTTHRYDLLGRRTATQTPDGGLVEHGWDADGNQISEVTPNERATGVKTTYAYQLRKLTGIDYPGDTPDVSYTYGAPGAASNGAGRVIRSEDGARIRTLGYDAAGQLTRETAELKAQAWRAGGDNARLRWTTGWSYDPLGRVTGMAYPDGEKVAYGYDQGGRLATIAGTEAGKTSGGRPTTFSYPYLTDRQYDEFGQVRWQQLGNQVTTESTYDAGTRWLTRQRTVSPQRQRADADHKEVADLTYTYDDVGNPLGYVNDLAKPDTGIFGGRTEQTYRYDAYERLVGSTGTWEGAKVNGLPRRYAFEQDFDADGNVVRKSQTLALGGTGGGTPTSDVRVRTFSSTQPHQVATEGVQDRYTYDADGNFTGLVDGRGIYQRQALWDSADRLTMITENSTSTRYRYDDRDELAIEQGPGGETLFVNPWVTIRPGGQLWKSIWAGEDRLALQRDQPNGTQELDQSFLHPNLQGSTTMVTDRIGNTPLHREYLPSGQPWVLETTPTLTLPYQFAGAYVDQFRAMLSIGSRWYDPARSMFYSPDPVLTEDPDAVTEQPELRAAYGYAGDNPVANTDPTGLLFERIQPAITRARTAVGAIDLSGLRTSLTTWPRLRAAADRTQTFVREAPGKVRTELRKARDYLQDTAYSRDPKVAQKARQSRFEKFDAKPLVEFNLSTKTLKLSLSAGPRYKREFGGGAKPTVPATTAAVGTPPPGPAPGRGSNRSRTNTSAASP